MKKELAAHLESNKDILIAEWQRRVISIWQERLASERLSSGLGSRETSCDYSYSRHLSELVHWFYNDLLSLLQPGSKKEHIGEKLPHYMPDGARFTLPNLLEIFALGEEALAQSLLLDRIAPHPFQSFQALTAFEEVRETMRKVALHHADILCSECAGPLTKVLKRITQKK